MFKRLSAVYGVCLIATHENLTWTQTNASLDNANEKLRLETTISKALLYLLWARIIYPLFIFQAKNFKSEHLS